MTINDRVAELTPEVVSWRHHIHHDPELGFNEHRTAAFIAEKLRSFGLEVHTEVSETAVVAVLKRGTSSRRIALRAELDALPIMEKSGVPYASKNDNVMHACGHDGHGAILLGAAKLLAESENFDGTVYFIFQPAEEVVGGGRKMIEDGVFERFPVDQVFALHNWPNFPEGHIGVLTGPQMAAVDDFEITFSGNGCHAAIPHMGDDPVLAAANFVVAIQRVVTRSIDPLSSVVLSVTQIHGGNFNNFVPKSVTVEGTCRFFNADLSEHVAKEIQRVADGVASTHGVSTEVNYKDGYPSVINTESGVNVAVAAASETVGPEKVLREFAPSLGCEDFSFMLNEVKDGAYVWIGSGNVGPAQGLHGDCYVFNDDIVPVGLRYWQNLVPVALPV